MNPELVQILIPVTIQLINSLSLLLNKDTSQMTLAEIKELLETIDWPEYEFKNK